jgi:hypothetical protein
MKIFDFSLPITALRAAEVAVENNTLDTVISTRKFSTFIPIKS